MRRRQRVRPERKGEIMKCRILHESRGRLRIRATQYRMTHEQADKLEYYLRSLEGVTKAVVYERTCDAVIWFEGGRDAIVTALSVYDQERTAVEVPEHTGRALRAEYEDKLFFLTAQRLITQFVLPSPLSAAVTAVKSVRYIYRGVRCLLQGKLEVPVLDATSIGVSMLRGDYSTAGTIMFLLGLGELLEEWTHRKSVDDLAQRMYLNVDKVWMKSGGEEVLVKVSDVQPGDVVVVRAGNVIPLDGIVTSGEPSVNQASMTGESVPVHKQPGGYVYAGTVVEEGECEITVKSALGSGRYDRIVGMIEESEKLKSATESRAAHLADSLVPWSLGGTALLWLLTRDVTRTLSILMVDFSCALKLAMPLSVLSAMRECGEHHIDVKGGKFLEAVADADTIVFDKTGTLTKASPHVARVIAFGGHDEQEMLRLAACLEEHFPHSIANAVVQEARERGLSHAEKHAKVEYIVAHGIASAIDGERVLIGSWHFIFEDERCTVRQEDQALFDSLPQEYSFLYLALGGELAAVILIEDPIREEAPAVVRALHRLGLSKVVMMTGDSHRTAAAVAERVGVDEFHAEVLPEDKAAFVRAEHERGRKVIMIGDGINDSPALSEADVGVAVESGAAIAREVADITVSGDDLYGLVTLRRIACALMDRIQNNYRIIMGFNGSLIALGALGVLAPTTSALLHNASTLAISMHSMTDVLGERQPHLVEQPARTEQEEPAAELPQPQTELCSA